MKLYTEEQVRKVLHPDLFHLILPRMTPIELPSNEEIEKALPDGFSHSDGYDAGKICGFEDGAKWMKEQILNQNK